MVARNNSDAKMVCRDVAHGAIVVATIRHIPQFEEKIGAIDGLL